MERTLSDGRKTTVAVRIRSDKKTVVCAAKSKKEPGDVYMGDDLQYALGAELRVMSVCGRDDRGVDLWEFHAPITMDKKIIKEGAPDMTVTIEGAVNGFVATTSDPIPERYVFPTAGELFAWLYTRLPGTAVSNRGDRLRDFVNDLLKQELSS